MANKRKRRVDKSSSHGDGLADMDVSSGTRPDVDVDLVDASESGAGGAAASGKLSVLSSKKRDGGKVAFKRRAVKLRKEKAVEKALAMMEKRQTKKQKVESKAERVRTLKQLY